MKNKKLFVKTNTGTFILNEGYGETDMNNPEEKREVQIGKEIYSILEYSVKNLKNQESVYENLVKIAKLAEELVNMHGSQL